MKLFFYDLLNHQTFQVTVEPFSKILHGVAWNNFQMKEFLAFMEASHAEMSPSIERCPIQKKLCQIKIANVQRFQLARLEITSSTFYLTKEMWKSIFHNFSPSHLNIISGDSGPHEGTEYLFQILSIKHKNSQVIILNYLRNGHNWSNL